MPSESYQANADGSLVKDFDAPAPTMSEREAILQDGLTDRGWIVSAMNSNEQKKLTTFVMTKGARSLTIDAYIFPNLAWSSGGRSLEEKRIQLSRPIEEHAADFARDNSGNRRTLLLGIYRRQGQIVLCAWDAGAYVQHAKPSSCYVSIKAIAMAMSTGVGESIDSKKRLVFCFQPDLLAYYIENMNQLHERLVVPEGALVVAPPGEPDEDPANPADFDSTTPPNEVPSDLPRNRILYGAPGTGKSHFVDAQIQEYFGQPGLSERTTFHPDFGYAQFVGSYRPVPLYREASGDIFAANRVTAAPAFEPLIDYQFVPGPFLRMLIKAYQNPEHAFALVIEEINRANAPAVFGEVFQLLDRDDTGAGKFSVSLPPEARDYLWGHGVTGEVRLPANLYLWATMNSADQGVLPLDAAFKRRWSFEYLPLNAHEVVTADWQIKLNFQAEPTPWNHFRQVINDHLLAHNVPEDRLLGPFFMRRAELASADAFKNKLLLYLRDDVARHNPDMLFQGESRTYGALARAYDNKKKIFVETLNFDLPAAG